HFVALAEKTGMTRDAINTILKSVAERSAIQEFWITDPAGHAYLTNTGVDFTFSPDARPKIVMPKATAPIGSKICIAASRPLTLPVQVTNEWELHSRNGAT